MNFKIILYSIGSFLIGALLMMLLIGFVFSLKLPMTKNSSIYSIETMISGEPYFACSGIYQLSDPSYFCCITPSIHNKGINQMCFQIFLDTKYSIYDKNITEGVEKHD